MLKRKQNVLLFLVCNGIIILSMFIFSLIQPIKEIEEPIKYDIVSSVTVKEEPKQNEEIKIMSIDTNIIHNQTLKPTYVEPIEIEEPKMSDEDKYLLAKITMAEAEGESLETKRFVIITILNRVNSDEFPDTIKEVIYQKTNGVYQFSPIGDGRFKEVEPNEDSWKAVEEVLTNDLKHDALYFESCKGSSWHSRNLDYLFKSDNTKFYR